jgi:guanine deaminase
VNPAGVTLRNAVLRGPILNPRPGGVVDWFCDGALMCDGDGRLTFVGSWNDLAPRLPAGFPVRNARGIVTPPFLDAHIHIPQWPVRGRFLESVEPNAQGGPLLAGLNRNVFPTEARCADEDWTRQAVADFLTDTLAKGVVGGAAYMTVHAAAVRIALEMLPDTWQVGLVLMNCNCPTYLRTDESTLDRDIAELAERFGRRLIVTDRFAAAVDSPLRRRAVALAHRFGLRMQTHLNEQIAEKTFVERKLYPSAGTYTNVYKTDGLLDCQPILAHCVRMSEGEFRLVTDSAGASIAHCPTSNTLLGSGVMPLDLVRAMNIPYAICTDVGASPTTSILAEMAQFLKVHAGRTSAATPSEALYRATLAPAQILRLDSRLGSFEVGKPLSFIEIASSREISKSRDLSADQVIREHLLDGAGELNPSGADEWIAARDQLLANGLEPGPEADLLRRDFDRTMSILDRKVLSVTVANSER